MPRAAQWPGAQVKGCFYVRASWRGPEHRRQFLHPRGVRLLLERDGERRAERVELQLQQQYRQAEPEQQQ